MHADVKRLCPDVASFRTKIDLTENSLRIYKDVVKVVFEYLATIRFQQPQESVMNEILRQLKRWYFLEPKSSPGHTTRHVEIMDVGGTIYRMVAVKEWPRTPRPGLSKGRQCTSIP